MNSNALQFTKSYSWETRMRLMFLFIHYFPSPSQDTTNIFTRYNYYISCFLYSSSKVILRCWLGCTLAVSRGLLSPALAPSFYNQWFPLRNSPKTFLLMRQQPRAGKGLHGAALLVQQPGALESCGEYGSQLLPIREMEGYTGLSIRRWNLFLVDNGEFDAAELESRAIMASQLLQLASSESPYAL